jgi:hypothetical protein
MCSGKPLDYGCDRQPKWKPTHPLFSFFIILPKGSGLCGTWQVHTLYELETCTKTSGDNWLLRRDCTWLSRCLTRPVETIQIAGTDKIPPEVT